MNLPPLPEPFYITRSNGRLYEVESGADVTGRVIDAYTQDQLRQAQREAVAVAVSDAPTDAAVWAMARKMADIFDYPWGSMPLSGRQKMFQNVKEIIAAAPEVKP